MASKEQLLIASAAFLLTYKILKEKRTKKKVERRWWITELYKHRKEEGHNILNQLKVEISTGQFQNFVRMSCEDFEVLIQMIGPKVVKKDTRFRDAIPISVRLAITLRFLATGDSYTSLQYVFKVSKQAISTIIMEVCPALIEGLRSCVKMPSTTEEWESIASQFESKWNFPHCVGAMDGKHIMLQCPMNSGSEYYNYKSFFSIVLFALVDADYNFLFVDVGCQGRISDSGVFKHTELYKRIESKNLALPEKTPLPGRNMNMPYVILGDEAFPLTENIMKPYSGNHNKGTRERIYNYRLSRARRVVENVFGICSSVFRILRKPMLLQPEKAEIITLTIVYLHNFLRKSTTSRASYCPSGMLDNERNGEIVVGSWRTLTQTTANNSSFLPLNNVPRRPSQNSQNIRREFTDYFVTNGTVPWQNNCA